MKKEILNAIKEKNFDSAIEKLATYLNSADGKSGYDAAGAIDEATKKDEIETTRITESQDIEVIQQFRQIFGDAIYDYIEEDSTRRAVIQNIGGRIAIAFNNLFSEVEDVPEVPVTTEEDSTWQGVFQSIGGRIAIAFNNLFSEVEDVEVPVTADEQKKDIIEAITKHCKTRIDESVKEVKKPLQIRTTIKAATKHKEINQPSQNDHKIDESVKEVKKPLQNDQKLTQQSPCLFLSATVVTAATAACVLAANLS